MRNLSDALLWRGTKADAVRESRKYVATARRLGYDVVVHGTLRRYGTSIYEERPYGVFLQPRP
jgi:hypothetical protein